eukprot:gene11596-11814_t
MLLARTIDGLIAMIHGYLFHPTKLVEDLSELLSSLDTDIGAGCAAAARRRGWGVDVVELPSTREGAAGAGRGHGAAFAALHTRCRRRGGNTHDVAAAAARAARLPRRAPSRPSKRSGEGAPARAARRGRREARALRFRLDNGG